MKPSTRTPVIPATMNQKNLNYEIETCRSTVIDTALAMNQKNLNYEIETMSGGSVQAPTMRYESKESQL